MNVKGLSLYAGCVGSLLMAAPATGGYVDLTAVSDGGNAYGTTWRIYANFTDAADELHAVFGDGSNLLSIDSVGGFYQNPYGGNTAAAINPAFIPIFPSLAYDSWVTIGEVYWTDNVVATIGIDFTGFAAGGAITTDNGAWFVTPDDAQAEAGSGLQVMIGQFTSLDGSAPIGSVSMQGSNADGSVWSATGETWVVPAPGALALLGLAGIVGGHRRRR